MAIQSNNRKQQQGVKAMDYYATPPEAIEKFLRVFKFNKNIWEPACGEGHISKILEKNGYTVRSTDIIDRGYGLGIYDFLTLGTGDFDGDIVTNPPFMYALEFVEKALKIIPTGNNIAFFIKNFVCGRN